MSRARQEEAWARTSGVMAMVANTMRTSKSDPVFDPADFHPFMEGPGRRSRGIPLNTDTLHGLKKLVPKGRKRNA